MRWITRSNIKVDRVACPWLIRGFVDPGAEFMFVAEAELVATAKKRNAIPFDAPRLPEVKLNHRGERCTFEVIIEDYKLDEPGLRAMAEGFAATGLSDKERLARQFPVYDALYQRSQGNRRQFALGEPRGNHGL